MLKPENSFSPTALWSLSLFAVAVMLVVLPAQSTAQSSVTRSVDVAEYQRVYLRGSAQVRVTQVAAGEGSDSVIAVGDAQYIDSLTLESDNKTLFIDAGDDHAVERLVIHLQVEELTELVNEGSGEIIVIGLVASHLALEGRGEGRFDLRHLQVDDLVVVGEGQTEFKLNGHAQNQFIDLAGVGRYRADHLASETSQVSVRGSGQVELNVRELLDVDILGAAQIRYSGSPVVRKNVLGSGRLKSVGF